MPQSDIDALISRLSILAKALWALVAIGFAAGVWGTTMQLKINALEKWAEERSMSIREYEEWRRELAGELATLKAVAGDLKAGQERIEDLLKEVKGK